ncbi:MAG: DUF615 domain-containing protein [Desulfoprunum sp.]|nr:DUF615 domain-containing protein [Desulfoprunum sp.]
MTEIISRSEQKRRLKRIEDTAAELAELTNKDLVKFPGSEEIKKEIVAIRELKGGSRKRQIKHLAKVMRQEPLEPVYDFLSERKGSHLKEENVLREAERLRDTIINEAVDDQNKCRMQHIDWEPNWESPIIDDAVQRYQGFDEDAVRKVAYQYIKTRNKVHYRELFRITKAALDLEEIRKRTV